MKRVRIAAFSIILLGSLLLPAQWSRADGLPLAHPREEGDLRACSDCHESEAKGFPFRRFEHSPLFAQNHRLTAVGSEQVCAMCHQPSFCSDCHAQGAAMKPSLMAHGDTRRLMPHQGDYLTRHRIDGHIDPTGCFRCHGRPKSAKSCAPCHG
ncbi:MAG: hypothetical protein M0036_20830 [Desulfobacteraceae bacterium]|nr:hypothetical protein [Desulfobacteraceae bacterium]